MINGILVQKRKKRKKPNKRVLPTHIQSSDWCNSRKKATNKNHRLEQNKPSFNKEKFKKIVSAKETKVLISVVEDNRKYLYMSQAV